VPTPPAQIVFQLRVSLVGSEPLVWRRLLVPGSVSMARLHDMFQAAMGWTNSHLHCFTVGGERYGMQYDEYPEGEIDEKTVKVRRAIGARQAFQYEYDFGDSWDHEVVVEQSVMSVRGLKHAVCLAGENACPPEDCGGVYGYADLLRVLADAQHEDHEHLMAWAGGPIDPTAFDLVAANVALQGVR
jgi:hypothetical protein